MELGTASWFEELKRRRVFRALVGYGLFSFAVLQVIEPVMHGLSLPEWVLSATVIGLGLGFPLALVLAWIFDVKGGRVETTAGPAPRARFFALLVLAGLLLGAPGVGWYFWRSNHAGDKVASAGAPSIAVLPFTDLSPARDQDWMCDGIAEEILDALTSVTGLRVAARSSSFQFKGKTPDVRAMSRTLGVSTLLEGSVRKVGDRMRVSARLVSADGYELWANKFDRGVQDAYAIQEEIARAVVAALQVRMNSDEASRLRRTGTTQPQAYEMYLRGRQYLRELNSENLELGRQMFRRAIALDPSFAQPRAGLADTDATMLQWLLATKETVLAVRKEALEESEAAARLAPDLAEAQVARGNVLAMLGRNEEAEQSFRRATALAPGLRDAWYWQARFLFSIGRYRESAQAYQEAAKRDPDDYDSLSLQAMPYNRLGEEAKARESARRAVEVADRVLRNRPDDVRALYLSAGSMIFLGDRQRGLARLDQAVALQPHDFSVLYNAACGYARAGAPDKALDMLDRAVDSGRGFRPWMEHDPDFDSLHGHLRFQQILARLPP